MNGTRDEHREREWQKEAGDLHDRIHEVAALVDYHTRVEIGWAPEEAIPMLAKALQEAYMRGRREAIEEAADVTRCYKCEAEVRALNVERIQ